MKKVLIAFVLFVAGIFLYMLFFKPSDRTKETTQRKFEQMMDAGEVSDICILDDKYVTVVLNEKGQNSHGAKEGQPHYSFVIISQEAFEMDLAKLDTNRIKIHRGLPSIGPERFTLKQ